MRTLASFGRVLAGCTILLYGGGAFGQAFTMRDQAFLGSPRNLRSGGVSWQPATVVGIWTDGGGAHTGDLTAFSASADLSTLSVLNLSATAITSLTVSTGLPALQHLQCANCSSVTNIDVSGVTAMSGNLLVNVCSSLTSLNLGSMTSIGGSFYTTSDTSLVTVQAGSLTNITGSLNMAACSALATLSLSSLLHVGTGAFNFTDDASLATLNLAAFVPVNGQGLGLTGCALNVTTVNQILARCVASGPIAGAVYMTGGSSAAPTGQGITDKATLNGRGFTATTN